MPRGLILVHKVLRERYFGGDWPAFKTLLGWRCLSVSPGVGCTGAIQWELHICDPPEEKCSLLGQGDNRREGHDGKALSNPLQPHHQRQGSSRSPTGTREYEAVSWLNSPFFPLSLHPSSEPTPEDQEPVALAAGGNYRSKLK